MDEPDISNRCWDQRLKRPHAESLNDSCSNQGREAGGDSTPEAGDHQTDSGDEIHWSLAVLDSESVPDQGSERDGYDDAALHTLDESSEGDVKFGG